jgi:serine/threonine protein kinase
MGNSSTPPPGVAALLRHTVKFPQGSAPNRLPQVRRRNVHAAPVAGPPMWESPDDEDDPTELRAVGPGLDGWPRSGSVPSFADGAEPIAPGTLYGSYRVDPIAPGTLIGSYRVLEPVANGGMGVVFLGEHLQLGRKVALKFLHERLLSDQSAVARFFAEAVAGSRISHPGAVTVFDYGSFEGRAYMVMEFLRGETLSARLERERRLPITQVLDVGLQLGLTLAAAHEAGVIHRDLKPDNIHLVPDASGSGYEHVKVLDFGVAKLTSGAWPPQTQRGDILGTPLYMAPEQSVHAGNVDHRCDIYSLGCVLYQLVTGLAPFRGSMFEILIAHQKEPPPSPRSFDPTIPSALDLLIRRMMTKSPDGRPGTMADVVRELSRIEREQRARVDRPPSLRRTRAAWFGLLVGIGLIAAGLGHLAELW